MDGKSLRSPLDSGRLIDRVIGKAPPQMPGNDLENILRGVALLNKDH
ncbi:hypothetical protein ACJ73_09980 [Blastomyces percursus]|uniref:Uncharacterized protein n=1 Tax=Blastomyces percursus TaxID=1658174 RepID=A0A1J9NZL0_9EURO|nr:hypothetical protein ACJ73_09980 [Blastomyces percursus]